MYKLVSVDSLAAYCDEPPPSASPPKRPPASSPPVVNAAGKVETPSLSSSPNDETVAAATGVGETAGEETVGNEKIVFETAGNETAGGEAGISRTGRKCDGAAACRSFLAAGLSDEDLEGMFRTSLAGGEDGHSYVVVPASPSFRLRVQRGGGGGTCASDGGSSKYKVEALFNDVSGAMLFFFVEIGEIYTYERNSASNTGIRFYV